MNNNRISIDDFFIPSNSINHIPEQEYQKVDIIIKAIDSISRTSYQCFYIIDYFKKDFLYVCGNELFLGGLRPEDVKELGFNFYLNHIPAEEQALFSEIYRAGFHFFSRLPKEDRLDYTIFYNLNLLHRENNRKMLLNHKLTPIILDKHGKIWLAACVVSLSSVDDLGRITIRKMGEVDFWEYNLANHEWNEMRGVALSEKEKNVLILSAQGYTMRELADILCVSLDTVKFYKRRIFDKMGVKNTTEALSFATTFKLI